VTTRGGRGVAVLVVISATAYACSSPHPPTTDNSCDKTKISELLDRATPQNPEVSITCSIKIPKNFIVTKRIVVEGGKASGVTLDCNGQAVDGSRVPELVDDNLHKQYMITVKAVGSGEATGGSWSRPSGVTIKNCSIIGSIRLSGPEQSVVRNSSFAPGHPQRMRAISPTGITLDHLIVTPHGNHAVYFGAGVTYSRLTNSELAGEGPLAVYLDAESAGNTIKNNYIHTVTDREVLAVDSSEFNQIFDNRFSGPIARRHLSVSQLWGERHGTPINS